MHGKMQSKMKRKYIRSVKEKSVFCKKGEVAPKTILILST